MEQAPVVVGEREVEQHHVAGLGQAIVHLVALLHHRVVVAVADHAGLRRAGRPRRVDEREELVLVDRVGALVECGRVLRGVRPPAFSQRAELRERDDVLDARPRDLRALVVVLDEDADRLRVLEDVVRVARASSTHRSAPRPRRRARARSRRAPTRGSCARAGRMRRPSGRRARAGRLRARRPRAAASAQVTSTHSPSTSCRYAGSGCAAATASRHRFAIVRARATSGI